MGRRSAGEPGPPQTTTSADHSDNIEVLANTGPAHGLDAGETSIFRLDFDWDADIRTSLHKHRGWELVLVRAGTIHAVVDGERSLAGPGQYLSLPTGSVHAIWAEDAASFEVIGERGLGLTMIVPTTSGDRGEAPIYFRDGPWTLRRGPTTPRPKRPTGSGA